MRRANSLLATAAAALLTLGVAGCGSDSTNPVTSTPPTPTSTPTPTPVTAEDYDPANFTNGAVIDHKWFPMKPGKQYRYSGETTEGTETFQHEVVYTVTGLTKEIDGVTNAVIWALDYSDGELVEAEIAFFAQDDDGNIWHFGEYPEEYDGGKFDKAPAWMHGYEGATVGVTIRAEPKVGDPDHAQGYAPPPINWVDRARISDVGQEVCVPAGCYTDVIIAEEFEPDKPDAFQLKYYAPGVGNIRVGWRGANEETKENLLLDKVVDLDEKELAKANEAALALEKRAYKIAKGAYGETEPSKLAS